MSCRAKLLGLGTPTRAIPRAPLSFRPPDCGARVPDAKPVRRGPLRRLPLALTCSGRSDVPVALSPRPHPALSACPPALCEQGRFRRTL